ncbi:NAD-dependent epimerase/dehydratase family protein [Actinomadura formosensis]|uniref:NAD-dependent epimerase/dehydratase family protein n=1 Tax=Actinomadura formosensis TaxID=60706 RepID=UPI00082DD747|nr:NAD-dependent epimerase/dehydratase family protein [Actinomadura formosensis]
MSAAPDLKQVLEEIKALAPADRAPVTAGTLARLRVLARELVLAHPGAAGEYHRFLAVSRRTLRVPRARLRELVADRTVLVTGACGRVGAALMAELAALAPARVLSLDRSPVPPVPWAEHHVVDVCDGDGVARVVHGARPHLVFHLAARHAPAPAHACDPVTTILGTRHVVESAVSARAGMLVLGSDEHALLPYARDTLAASERIAELIVADAATRGLLPTAIARSAHVVEGSAPVARFQRSCRDGAVLWLPLPAVPFHVQSVRETARLLLVAALGARDDGTGLHAVRSLPRPVTAFDLAVGVMAEEGVTAVRVAEDTGDGQRCPDLSGQMGTADRSAVLNAFESPLAGASASPDADVVPVRFRLPEVVHRQFDRVARQDAADVLDTVDALARTLLEGMLVQSPRPLVRRVATLTWPKRAAMTATDRMVDDRVRWWAER